MSEPVKQIGYGEGIRKYSMNMEEYDAAYHHGFTAGVDESKRKCKMRLNLFVSKSKN